MILKRTRGNVVGVHGGDLVVAEGDVSRDLIEAASQLCAPVVRDSGHGLPGHAVRSEKRSKLEKIPSTDA